MNSGVWYRDGSTSVWEPRYDQMNEPIGPHVVHTFIHRYTVAADTPSCCSCAVRSLWTFFSGNRNIKFWGDEQKCFTHTHTHTHTELLHTRDSSCWDTVSNDWSEAGKRDIIRNPLSRYMDCNDSWRTCACMCVCVCVCVCVMYTLFIHAGGETVYYPQTCPIRLFRAFNIMREVGWCNPWTNAPRASCKGTTPYKSCDNHVTITWSHNTANLCHSPSDERSNSIARQRVVRCCVGERRQYRHHRLVGEREGGE